MIIEAGTELTLKAGGSFIKLDPGGITLGGPLARLNAGGAPDKDKAGNLLDEAQPNRLEPGKAKARRVLNFSG